MYKNYTVFFFASACLVLALITPTNAACYDADIIATNRTNEYCSWYNSNSCCNNADVINYSMTKLDTGCRTPPRGCQEQVVKMLCGLSCSPKYSEWYDKDTGKVRMCKDFAQQIWDECSGASFKVASNVGTMEFGGCRQLSHRYVNAEDLVEKGYNMIYEDDDSMVAAGRCFNAGERLAPPSVWMIAVLAVAMRLLH